MVIYGKIDLRKEQFLYYIVILIYGKIDLRDRGNFLYYGFIYIYGKIAN